MKVITIPKNPIYPTVMDWEQLRREGIKHIERLGSSIWTDYNAHDPGITTLEILCYAITDLGYRLHNIESKDLFAVENGDKAFHTAAEILPNAPVTALDLRKIIIDVDGVKNAWLEKQKSELVLTLNKTKAFSNQQFKNTIFAKYITVLGINADAEIVLNLNTPPFNESTPKNFQEAFINDEFAKLFLLYLIENQLDNVYQLLIQQEQLDDVVKVLAGKNIKTTSSFLEKIAQKLKKEEPLGSNQKAELDVFLNEVISWSANKAFSNYYNNLLFSILFDKDILIVKNKKDLLVDDLILEIKGIYNILVELEEGRSAEKHDIKAEILQRVHANRPLCEDFGDIKFLDKEPFGVCANIELESDADPIKVQAAIYYAIEEFLTPTIHFYSLEERMNHFATFWLNEDSLDLLRDAMLPRDLILTLELGLNKQFVGKKAFLNYIENAIGAVYFEDYENIIFENAMREYDSDPVYQGPLLKHGFVDDSELQKAELRRTIYKSDLFTVILGVKGVSKIQHLDLKKCEDDAVFKNEWCLSFDCECVPVLGKECSTFRFGKGNGFIELKAIDAFEVDNQLEMLRAANQKVLQSVVDLPIPKGQYLNELKDFTSTQIDFPRTYQIGKTFIAKSETVERKAQAKQLQGYLLFFDQIFANYLAQLAQVREIFAVEKPTNQMPLYQMLSDVPGFNDLIKDKTAYENALKALTAGNINQQQIRENKILDHLLARFGEQFSDYVLSLYNINNPLSDDIDSEGGLGEWINDKKRFLKNLPLLNGNRSLGFNYLLEPQEDGNHLWNSPNIEGVKSRVCAQLGINCDYRKTISCEPKFETEIRLRHFSGQKRHYFVLLDAENEVLLESSDMWASEKAATKAAEDFSNQAANSDNYEVKIRAKDNVHYVGFWDVKASPRTDVNILLYKNFKTKDDADAQLKEIQKLIDGDCQTDNFHIVEHILLRPFDESYKALNATDNIKHLDPYSFQVSVLVPVWADRFKDAQRFYHFEQTLRSEMPAHIAICIKKLGKKEMLEFENIYVAWLQQKNNPDTEPFEMRQSNDNLVEFLNTQKCSEASENSVVFPTCP